MSSSVLEAPIHLLKPDDKHRLSPVPASIEKLKSITGPVVMVAIVGTQRGGKSTLLNLLRNRETAGFGVGHLMDPQTTGLWLWDRKHPRNPNLTILLMDTEGLDAPHVPQWYNWTLSAMALLTSSMFIYQTKGQIDAHSTERLSVILKVAEQLKGGQQLAQEKAGHISNKPQFMWLLRDSQLVLQGSPKQEMVAKLAPNDVKALERYFESYDCFPLPRPVDKEADLQKVEEMPYDALRSEFKEEYCVLERQIFTALQNERHLAGRVITGETIASLITSYADAIQSRQGIVQELTALPSQWQMVAKISGERAVKMAVKLYKTKMDALVPELPVPESRLASVHEEAFAECLQLFYVEALIDDPNKIPEESREFLELLESRIREWSVVPTVRNMQCVMVRRLVGGAYFGVWERNMKLSKDRCEQTLKELYAPLEKRVEQGAFGSVAEFRQALDKAVADYNGVVALDGFATRAEVLADLLDGRARADQQRIELALLEARFKAELVARDEKISALEARYDAELKTLAKRLEEEAEVTSNRINQVESNTNAALEKAAADSARALEQLKEVQNERFTNLGEKVAGVQERIGAMEAPLAAVAEKVATLAPRVDAVATRIDSEVMPAFGALETKLSGAIERVGAAQDAKVEAVKASVADVRSTLDKELQRVDIEQRERLMEVSNKCEDSIRSKVAESAEAVTRAFKDELGDQRKRDAEQLEKMQAALVARLEATVADAAAAQQAIEARIAEVQAAGAALVESKASGVGEESARLVAELDAKLSALLDERVSAEAAETSGKLEALDSELRAHLQQSVEAQQRALDEKVSGDVMARVDALEQELGGAKSNVEALSSRVDGVDGAATDLARQLEERTMKSGSELSAQLSGVQEQIKLAEEREQDLQKRLALAMKNSIDNARQALEAQIAEAADVEFKADVKRRLEALDDVNDKTARELERFRASTDAIWESSAQLASRLVNCEALLDRQSATGINSQKAAQEHRSAGQTWLGKIRGGMGGGGGSGSGGNGAVDASGKVEPV